MTAIGTPGEGLQRSAAPPADRVAEPPPDGVGEPSAAGAEEALVRELSGIATRMLGPGTASLAAVASALSAAPADRVEAILLTVRACRAARAVALPEDGLPPAAPGPRPPAGELAAAVAAELAAASATLAVRHREALLLRERLNLSHDQIARVMGLEPSAVAALLARARIELHEALRGPRAALAPCPEPDRALRLLARRQDGEPVTEAEEDWLFAHLGACPACERAHAQMLEAALRHRAWVRP